MKQAERDLRILRHVIEYCDQIEETIARFGDSEVIFSEDKIYRNAAALCLLQIGELVGQLTDDFRQAPADVPWRQIRSVRNLVAHRYGTIDPELAWEILQADVPILKEKCVEILQTETAE